MGHLEVLPYRNSFHSRQSQKSGVYAIAASVSSYRCGAANTHAPHAPFAIYRKVISGESWFKYPKKQSCVLCRLPCWVSEQARLVPGRPEPASGRQSAGCSLKAANPGQQHGREGCKESHEFWRN